jgi:hypothetical protein
MLANVDVLMLIALGFFVLLLICLAAEGFYFPSAPYLTP